MNFRNYKKHLSIWQVMKPISEKVFLARNFTRCALYVVQVLRLGNWLTIFFKSWRFKNDLWPIQSLYRDVSFYNSYLEIQLLDHEPKWRNLFMILKDKTSVLSILLRKKMQICSQCKNYFKVHVSLANRRLFIYFFLETSSWWTHYWQCQSRGFSSY